MCCFVHKLAENFFLAFKKFLNFSPLDTFHKFSGKTTHQVLVVFRNAVESRLDRVGDLGLILAGAVSD